MKALKKTITFKDAVSALAQGGFTRSPSVTSRYGEVLNKKGQFIALITEHLHYELVMTLSGCTKHGHNEIDPDVRGAVYHYMTINGDFAFLANLFISEEKKWKEQRALQLANSLAQSRAETYDHFGVNTKNSFNTQNLAHKLN